MIRNYQIIILFNARWEDGCDYALQTIRLLAETNQVIAVPLAHEVSIWRLFKHLWRNHSVFSDHQQVSVFTPIIFLPFRSFSPIRTANMWLNARVLWLILQMRQVGQKAASKQNTSSSKRLLWFFEPMYVATWFSTFSSWSSLYDCVDYWPGFVGSVSRQHEWLVRRVTTMVVNSMALLKTTQLTRSDAALVPLGFASAEFSNKHLATKHQQLAISQLSTLLALRKGMKKKQKIFGFVGQIGNRFDFPWMIRIMRAFPEHVFVFVGAVWAWKEIPSNDYEKNVAKLRAEPNCVVLPPVSKSLVPVLVQQFDFGLIPYATKQIFNKYCHPMKLYEYWWFGKPVVATDIYELSRYKELLIATNSSAKAIRWIQATLQNSYTKKNQAAIKKIANCNSWEAKLAAISQIVLAKEIK